jgi:hypothetical protein
LDRADAEWLLATHQSGGMRGPVDWHDRKQRKRAGTDLRGANLMGAHLFGLPLACLRASLTFDAEREGSGDDVVAAVARIDRSNLQATHLQRAVLRNVSLVDAALRGARLGSALQAGTNLRIVTLSPVSNLYNASLNDAEYGEPRIRDIQWNGADLTAPDWSRVRRLGDERAIRTCKRVRLNDYPNATRVYCQLATVLRSQGLVDDSDRFAYRARVLQRQVYRRQGIRRWPAYLGLLVLVALSGYGCRLWRILFTCILTLAVLVAAYYGAGVTFGPPLTPYEAVVIGFTAIHGRVLLGQFGLDSALSLIAGVEAVARIVIEGVFVAMLIQRFFSR